ncbi:amidohydrolase family protein [Ferrovibrio terrae]|uniref:N-acyl-D-amino-acid deacylase family protein n=1 Tax=Ferrovibrio terrae TaxID=2594003 RepID=UPI00313836C6
MAYDLKIVGGTIIDGTGKPGYSGDVGIKDGRIVALGHAPDTAARTVKADGLVVSPGFVDIHTHYDAQVFWDQMLTISPWHGVTSVVMGSCGFGVAPTRPKDRSLILRTLERVEAMPLNALEAGLGNDWPFETFPQYLDALDKMGTAINVGAMIGHTATRLYVMGEAAVERAATQDEVIQMQDIVREGMKAGAIAFGTSVSRIHIGFDGKPIPSRLAEFDEMLALGRAVGQAGSGIIHYNGAREPLFDHYLGMHYESGRPVCWTALLAGQLGPGRHRESLERTKQLVAQGKPIYPQVACRPIVSEFDFRSPVVFDTWSLFKPVRVAKGEADLMRIYSDKDFRHQFREEVAGRGGRDGDFSGGKSEGDMRRASWRLTEISWCEEEPALVGRTVESVAQERGISPVDLILDLAVQSNLRARFRMPLVNFQEDEVEELLQDPNTVVGLGDGGAHLSQLCDACYATHLLGYWVRVKKSLSLERAVHMLTGRPAAIFGIADRGLLALGRPADVVVFDPATVGAGPLERVYDLPAGADRLISRASGIHTVIVNGTVLPPPGEAMPAGRMPGHVLRSGTAHH